MISWLKLNFNSAVISAIISLLFNYTILEAVIIQMIINFYSVVVVYLARKGYEKNAS